MPRTQPHHRGRPSHVYNVLERTGLRKGFGGSKPWLYVGTGMWAFRIMRRFGDRREEILVSERLRPGERIVIANGVATIEGAPAPAPLGRRGRRRAAKRTRKAERSQTRREARAARRRRPAPAVD
jgi:hypothetical protein